MSNDPNRNRFDELRDAIDDGDAARVREIVASNPQLVTAADDHGVTALMHAAGCMGRSPDVLRVLLDAGFDVNRQTAEGYTALHCAIDVNFDANLNAREVIALLVAAGADLRLRQHYGWTPLLRAVIEGTAVEVEALLQAGADPNDTLPAATLPSFNAGRTALMAAISTSQSAQKILALLGAGANPMATGDVGVTFFEYARQLQEEYAGGDFGGHARRCAALAAEWAGNDA